MNDTPTMAELIELYGPNIRRKVAIIERVELPAPMPVDNGERRDYCETWQERWQRLTGVEVNRDAFPFESMKD